MAFSFGTPAASNPGQSSTPSFSFGNNASTPAPTGGFSFVPSQPPAASPGGFSFGQKRESDGQQQQQQQQKPAFSFGAPAAKSNNVSSPSNLFGSSTPAFGTQQASSNLTGSTQPASNLFGSTNQGQTQQPSNLFGSTQGQTQSSLFGQAQPNLLQSTSSPQQQQPLAQSFFGAASIQPQFSWSRPSAPSLTMPTFTPQPAVLQSSITKTAPEQSYGPGQPSSIADQFTKLKDAWDPTSQDCRFQSYFYNRVDPGLAALYTRPNNFPLGLWEEAVAQRPDDSVVPVLATGFQDLQARSALQDQQVHAYRVRIHEIAASLKQLGDRHAVYAEPACNSLQKRGRVAQARLLALAARVQVLKSRGYALRPEEATLQTRLETLRSAKPGGLQDPATFGRLEECRAKLVLLKQREQQVALQIKSRGHQSRVQLEDIDAFVQVLQDGQAGLQFLTRTLQQDLEHVEQVKRQLER